MQFPLLPHAVKKPGWFFLIASCIIIAFFMITGKDLDSLPLETKVLSIYYQELLQEGQWFVFIKTNITFTLLGISFLVGAFMVGFSREKQEDEFVQSLRLSSLLWAVAINSILMILGFVFFYGVVFINVMLANMFTVMLLFVVRFNFLLYKNQRSLTHEE